MSRESRQSLRESLEEADVEARRVEHKWKNPPAAVTLTSGTSIHSISSSPRTTVINCRDAAAVKAAEKAGVYVYVGRLQGSLGPWGNRYSHLESKVPGVVHVESREQAVQQHRKEVLEDEQMVARIREELVGKVLGCWCAPKDCHANTLAAIANGELG